MGQPGSVFNKSPESQYFGQKIDFLFTIDADYANYANLMRIGKYRRMANPRENTRLLKKHLQLIVLKGNCFEELLL